MQLSKDKVASLAKERGMTQNGIACLINIQPGSLSNELSGKRGVGRQILSALLREFEEESVASLTMKGGDAGGSFNMRGGDYTTKRPVRCANT